LLAAFIINRKCSAKDQKEAFFTIRNAKHVQLYLPEIRDIIKTILPQRHSTDVKLQQCAMISHISIQNLSYCCKRSITSSFIDLINLIRI